MKNIKFWVVGPKGWVKLKMKPDGMIRYYLRNTFVIFFYKGDFLYRSKIKGSTMSYNIICYRCNLDKLHYFKSSCDEVMIPFWEKII